MDKTALIYHEDYLKHDAGPGHPERRERLISVMDYFRNGGILDKVETLTPDPCSEEDLLRVHKGGYVEFVRAMCARGGGPIDADTFAQANTYDIARLAAGGVMLAGEVVAKGEFGNSLALVRPPGHHATRDKAMGFCYFNNVAVMARYLQEKQGLKKIMILDWDAHAANGTMDIFYDDPSVLNISIHQDPVSFYPGTGFAEQLGEGAGEGYTVNVPLRSGAGDSDYVYVLEELIIPLAKSFRPGLIVISTGFDSHKDDFISGLQLTDQGYGFLTEMMLGLARDVCGGKLVVELEGGYNLEAIARSSYAVANSLLGNSTEKVVGHALGSVSAVVEQLKGSLSHYHTII
ncbi:MAG: histone deacetylase [Candidatus Altiarchaeales archaeon]|nr:histone deacetylase [Candidatus Altiarchaeota archaeon]MBU4341530.1 histone deacetylase [Candidatus Altiarchaeota archaeon]MBU4406164.1 histone deacetylase [Candidatus Altiarchaeota archaeon]MBU4436997.1 histone deacetylase [Candidatus Altiarchaeota archaeon]MCG2782207.1 histone deacetylase [Candidatus Altiarchaeales archaeon]